LTHVLVLAASTSVLVAHRELLNMIYPFLFVYNIQVGSSGSNLPDTMFMWNSVKQLPPTKDHSQS